MTVQVMSSRIRNDIGILWQFEFFEPLTSSMKSNILHQTGSVYRLGRSSLQFGTYLRTIKKFQNKFSFGLL